MCTWHLYTYIFRCICVCMYVCIRWYMYAYIYIYMHIYTYVFTRISYDKLTVIVVWNALNIPVLKSNEEFLDRAWRRDNNNSNDVGHLTNNVMHPTWTKLYIANVIWTNKMERLRKQNYLYLFLINDNKRERQKLKM